MTTTTTPRLATVEHTAKEFERAGQNMNTIRAAIYRANDRVTQHGVTMPGNGLGVTGAIIRHGGRVLIDLDLYGAWLAGR